MFDIKSRICDNDAKQQWYVKEGEIISSPTASLVFILKILVIDAYKERDVAIVDMLGIYLYIEIPQSKGK